MWDMRDTVRVESMVGSYYREKWSSWDTDTVC